VLRILSSQTIPSRGWGRKDALAGEGSHFIKLLREWNDVPSPKGGAVERALAARLDEGDDGK